MRKSILIVIFFGLIGLASLYSGIDILLNVEDSIKRGFILVNYNNIFIRYGFSFICFFVSLGCIFLIILAVKNIFPIGTEYYERNTLAKAKSNFIIITVFLPSVFFFVSTIYYSGLKVNRPFLVYGLAAWFIYTYLASILKLTIFRHKYKIDKST